MKKTFYFLISTILIICLLVTAASAATVKDKKKQYEDRLEAINNSDLVPFTPTVLNKFDIDDWFSSSDSRAALSFLMALELSDDGYPEACDGLLNYNSFIGKTSDTYIVTGMYKNHTFEIYYSPKENSGAYRVTRSTLSEKQIQSSQENILSSLCSKYYANNKAEINSFYEIVSSSDK